jgi:uncharacterized protein YndB with AHSA1/START domain
MTIHRMEDDPLPYGSLEPTGDRWTLRFTRDLRHPPDKVWRALTEPDDLAAWFPSDIDGKREVGATLRFPFRAGEAPTLEGRMLAFDPPRLLEFSWGDDLLRFELDPIGDGGTRLTLINTFDEVGRGVRDAAGWHACLDNLERRLAGEASQRGGWKPLEEAYAERFPPEAATIGPPEGADTR